MNDKIKAWDMTQDQQRIRLEAIRYCEEEGIEDPAQFERVFQAMLYAEFMAQAEIHSQGFHQLAARYGINPAPYIAMRNAIAHIEQQTVKDGDMDLEAA